MSHLHRGSTALHLYLPQIWCTKHFLNSLDGQTTFFFKPRQTMAGQRLQSLPNLHCNQKLGRSLMASKSPSTISSRSSYTKRQTRYLHRQLRRAPRQLYTTHLR
ncbi:hypothetical protein DAPPUDRAFT_302899 [Daphnia pulex]|uniref:Uncharacterized protein n=1 Tax=Daphnia pulex TaxID=6669 RepID=E9HPW8_DAPPU|nr:hypothetical protein DAPPUDRAFT_302899 [Daphnia pulex]|eukprot:EFX66189.1 hypothetical protein DAPPUDRAFT_302899 [Daphnia pulex]